MIKKRLIRVAQILERIAKSKRRKTGFHMGAWLSKKPLSGTSCCAVGFAAQDPELRRLGLRLHKKWGTSWPVYKNHEQWDAVERFFGLNGQEAYELFMPDGAYDQEKNRDPALVAAKIREFVKREG